MFFSSNACLCSSRLQNGREEVICVATEDEVDVMISGYAFRLKILHEMGLKLMLNQGQFLR